LGFRRADLHLHPIGTTCQNLQPLAEGKLATALEITAKQRLIVEGFDLEPAALWTAQREAAGLGCLGQALGLALLGLDHQGRLTGCGELPETLLVLLRFPLLPKRGGASGDAPD
jgi:hypothetical protein